MSAGKKKKLDHIVEVEPRTESPPGMTIEIGSEQGIQKCGLVAIVGFPNAGKSTLLNALVGEKIAATSPIPQTTRTCIQGIVTEPRGQLILCDTPGLHRLHHAFNQLMVMTAKESILAADVVVWVVGLSPLPSKTDVDRMKRILSPILGDKPLVIAATRMDRPGGQGMIPELLEVESWGIPAEIVPISGLKKINLERLKDLLFTLVPKGKPFFDAEWYTNQSIRQLAREFIQEKIFRLLRDELPHQSAVMIEEFVEPEPPDSITRITGSIFVERPSQKAIMIGQGGDRISEISEAARKDIEKLIGGKVFLRMEVRLSPGWREDPRKLRELGYMPES